MSKQPERRRRIVRAFAPAVGLLAAGLLVWQGSYAAFSANTQANANAWSTGNLSLQNDSTGAGVWSGTVDAKFGSTNMKPGDGGSKCLTVQSTGSLSGDIRLYVNSLVESDASNQVAPMLDITVEAAPTTSEVSNCTGFPASSTTLYSGVALSSLPTDYAGASASDVSIAGGTVLEAYKITWKLNTAADNSLMSQTVTAGLTWEVQ